MTIVETLTSTVPLGGPSLPQERRLVTNIPGPKSQALQARKAEAVSAGVGVTLPVYIVAAGGGVLVDVDGNSLIDLGSGIAVTGVGNSAPQVVEAVAAQLAQFTHTCFTVAPYDSYIEVAETLNRLTPGDHAKRSALFNSGGGGERGQDCPALHRQAGRRCFRPRLSRPHHPDHGTDREEPALQERLRPVRRRALPRADVLPVP